METKIDILNRDEFINRVIQLVNLISSNKGNMTFAINGTWGCGKTFVLEEIERCLSEDKSKKYLVIHYNCWQYDYYDEPLVALVSAINDYADSNKTIPEDTRVEIKEIVTKVGANLFTQVVKNKLGVDIGETIAVAKDAFDSASAAVAERHGYDAYFGFKSALTALKTDLQALSEKYTLIFAVDELDRCLPEYAIKVLERLHHITEELPNTITILAVDKKRLENTVTAIFGEGNATDYLKKFVRFEIALNSGKPSGKDFFSKFKSFYDRFDPTLFGQLKNTEKFLEELFSDIDARTQEQIVEKAGIFNDICFGVEKQDHSIMYMELFLSVLFYHCGDKLAYRARPSDFEKPFEYIKSMPKAFQDNNSGFNIHHPNLLAGHGKRFLIDSSNIFHVIFFYWYHVSVFQRDLSENYLFPVRDEKDDRIGRNLEVLRSKIGFLSFIA